MVKTIATNSSNDMFLDGSGNVAFNTGVDAIKDICASATKMRLGEAIYQTNLGMPMFESIFKGTPNVAIYESYLRKTIMTVDGVISIKSLTASVSDGVFSYKATIETRYGLAYLNQ